MRDLTALETGNIHSNVIGGLIDAFGGGSNKRAKSAADKLIQGVRQATEAELAGLDAARAAALGGAVGGGLMGRQGIANALMFLTGQGVPGMQATDFGISPSLLGAEFGRAGSQPLKIFGEDGETTLLSPGGLDLTRAGLLTGLDRLTGTTFDPNTQLDRLRGTTFDPNTQRGPGMASRTPQPPRAIAPEGNPLLPGGGAGVLTGADRMVNPPGTGGLLGTVREPFQPFIEAGQEAVTRLNNPLTPLMDDPGFQFRLEQGQKALERSAAARGGLVSGQTMQDVNRFAQGLASQEYQNAFNRALATRQQALQTAGLGLGATGTQAGLTTDLGGRITQGLLGLGQQESDIARQIADIAAESSIGAGQAIANRERLLGEIKAGKKASQLTTGEQVNQAINPILGLGLGGLAAFGLPNISGLFGGGNRFQGRPLTPAEQLISSFGVGE